MSTLLIYHENLVNKNLIAWKNLNINKILAVSDFSQLKKSFAQNKINILLFDIEDSKSNEILKWIKIKNPNIKIIFLTPNENYKNSKIIPDFKFYEFIIKPITKEKLEASLSHYLSFSKFWLNYKPKTVEKFWFDILEEKISSNEKSIKEESKLRGIPYNNNLKIIPVILGIHNWHNKLKKTDEKIMEFGLKNIGEEIIANESNHGRFYHIKSGYLLGIISLDYIYNSDLRNFDEVCKKYIDICREYFECDLSCYVGNEIYIYELKNTIDKLLKLKEKNNLFFNKVITLKGQSNISGNIDLENMNTWLLLLRKGLNNKVIQYINLYLENLNSINKIDSNMLYKFQHDFIEIIYFALDQKDIEPNKLFSDENSLILHMYASNSIKDMMKWVVYTVEKVISYINKNPAKKSKRLY
jgi:two-component system response regulator YesN